MNSTTPIGITNWRSEAQPFGIKEQDRFGHIYCIGKTGVGKSTLLLNMAVSDIQTGKGVCVVDPHGDLAEQLLDYIPANRSEDVLYFNPADEDHPIGFNHLKAIHPQHHHLVTSGLISTFHKLWADSWGPRLEYILRFCILTLLEYPHATLLDIQPLLTDAEFRSRVLSFVKNPHTRAYWYQEFDKYPPAFRAEAISPILNKTGVFLSSSILRNIIGQRNNSFNMQSLMDDGKIVICNFSKGLLGEDISMLLGSMIVTAIQLAALHRARIPEAHRTPFFLYVDEVHSFISLSFADMLAEARKYKLGLFLTHQYLEQLPDELRAALFGNVGTLITFRVGNADAEYLAKELYPVFDASDLMSLPRYSVYLKLMIDGATSKPFSATTLPVSEAVYEHSDIIKLISRQKFGRNRMAIEKDIESRTQIYESDQNSQTRLF